MTVDKSVAAGAGSVVGDGSTPKPAATTPASNKANIAAVLGNQTT